MLHSQPKTWRTDFVIFTFNFTDDLRRLGCVNRLRQNKEEPSICRVFIYVPVRLRFGNISKNNFEHAFDDAKRVIATYKDLNDIFVSVPILTDAKTFDRQRSELLYTHLQTYGYIDSINVMYEGYPTFKMYDFVLRTDIGKNQYSFSFHTNSKDLFLKMYLSIDILVVIFHKIVVFLPVPAVMGLSLIVEN